MEAGTIAPADDWRVLMTSLSILRLQWRPGLLPRLTLDPSSLHQCR